MIYAVYFVPRESVHPHASLALYDQLWPIMHASVRKLGHRLVHITDRNTKAMGDDVFRVDVDPETTIYSRDVAWAEFVREMADGEQACMIEPDTVMQAPVPDLADGFDLALLWRAKDCIPGWFKLAKRTAAPFYDSVVRSYVGLAPDQLRLHGDMKALLRACGSDGIKHLTTPVAEAAGCKIEWRNWHLYGGVKSKLAYFLQFKGSSKQEMLRMAKSG